MDNRVKQENEGHKMDHYRVTYDMKPQYPTKEDNSVALNKKIMQAIAEKNAAIEELNRAISDRNSAIDERNKAIKLQNEAITARDIAFRERDSAIAALHFHQNTHNYTAGAKRMLYSEYTGPYPLSAVKPEDFHEAKKPKATKKSKKVGEDLNKQDIKSEWDAQDLELVDQINFDETVIPTPICTCTGVPRQCYKGGKGGWQSSCCTMSLSVYPLPQLPNRHSRINGRKMSRSVFLRVLSRVAAEGHDVSIPLDLKNYWGKHGTTCSVVNK